MLVNLIIDNEFKNLIPPLSNEEFKGLEENIIKDGCRDALILWNDILIDGHNRYEICNKHNIPFKTTQLNFKDRQAAIEWIILNQFGRRNLPLHERARLALKLKPVIAEKAKENERKGAEITNTGSQISVNPIKKIDTQKELAKLAGVSHDTIAKVEVIEEKAPQPVINASRKGDITVNTAYSVTKLEPEQQKEISERIEHIDKEPIETQKPKAIIQEVIKRPFIVNNSGNNEWYTPKEIIDAARAAMGGIDIDPASNDIAQKIIKADKYYTIETNGLDKNWTGNVWLNPPYSSDLISKFIDKLIEQRANYNQAIILVNNATETEWFNKLVKIASNVCFPKSRIKFYTPNGKSGAPLQGQAIIYIGSNTESFINEFSKFGWCCHVIQ